MADVGVDEMMLILACAGGGKCYEMMGHDDRHRSLDSNAMLV